MRTAQGEVLKLAYMFDKDEAFLRLLAHPKLLEIATALSPNPEAIVPTWEDLLVKPAFTGSEVPVHQDLGWQSLSGDVFSLGIYITGTANNPVCFLPGSHRLGPLTRTQIRALHKDRLSDFVPMRAEAGDVVIHNVLTARFSLPNPTPDPRYTWYVEFRTIEELRRDSPWPEEWIQERRALLKHAANLRTAHDLPTVEIPGTDSPLCERFLSELADGRGNRRVSHTGGGVEYDLSSPFNHFQEKSPPGESQ